MGDKWFSVVSLFIITSCLTPSIIAANRGCEYYKQFAVGQIDYFFNKEYPQKYKPYTNCLWLGESPVGTRIVISCSDISLPSSVGCNGDKLKISLSGDGSSFSDSKNFCGKGRISLVTEANRIAVGLYSNRWTDGGKFVCTLTAIKNTDTQNKPPAPSVCDCGWKKGTRIVGGVPTLVNEYPAMAGLVNTNSIEIICGSTIISNRYVLTAAHCMRAIPKLQMGILVGDWNISTGLDTSASELYLVEEYYEHPNFDYKKQINDLAIVKTKKPILFSLYVGPICLPFLYTYDNFDDETVTMLGWGQQFFSGPDSDTLEKINLKVVPVTVCQRQLPSNDISNNQLCTFARGKDSCQEDSGGPVIWQDPDTLRLQLVGVISYGLGCATKTPGINTRVTNYLPWIVSVTSDTNYCVK